jgi:two-component system heavy metal sensor histidine kinase CusS
VKPPVRRRSLAARLTTWYAFTTFAFVLAATWSLYSTVIDHIGHTETEVVRDRLQTLQVVLNKSAAHSASLAVIEEVEREWPGGPFALIYTRILDRKGDLLTETHGMSEHELPASVFPPPVDLGHIEDSEVVRYMPSGRVFALYAVGLDSRDNDAEGITAQVAVDATVHAAFLKSYRRQAAFALIFTLILATWFGYRIARRGLKPVERIGETLRRIHSSTLYERLDPSGLPVELSLLATTCNEMLDGLEESFATLSRFSADIAHELRTPINNLRGEVEVALSRPRTQEEYRVVLESCLEESQRLSKLIGSLLFVARAEGAAVQARKESLDLAKEIRAVAEFYEALATEGGVTLTVETTDDLVAPADRSLFQSALGNLVENALTATPRGGRVVVRATREGRHVRIEVADSGHGIAAEDLPRVFDRLYRADTARTGKEGASGGSGLGLAIVKSIATLHGGNVSIRSSGSSGTTATLTLPVA